MSHELTMVNGQAQVIVAREDAWHRLGKKVNNCFTALDGMQQIGLVEYVYKVPMFLPVLRLIESMRSEEIAAAYRDAEKGIFDPALWRFDMSREQFATVDIENGKYAAPLGYVGAGYQTLQIPKMFEIADAIVGSDLAIYDSMGSIEGGRKVFASLRLNEIENFSLGNGDTFDVYLNCVNSFDGTLAAQWFISSIRQVCKNTVNMSLANGCNFLKYKHSSGLLDKLEMQLKNFKGVVADSLENLKGRLDFLNSKLCDDETAIVLLDSLFNVATDEKGNVASENKVSSQKRHKLQAIMDLYKSNDQNAFADEKGTMLNLLNAVVEFTDHFASVRVSSKAHTDNRDVLRAENALLGATARAKDAAFDAILKAAHTAPDKPAHTMVQVALPDGSLQYEEISENENVARGTFEFSVLDSILDGSD